MRCTEAGHARVMRCHAERQFVMPCTEVGRHALHRGMPSCAAQRQAAMPCREAGRHAMHRQGRQAAMASFSTALLLLTKRSVVGDDAVAGRRGAV
jgi:hypothetical protein